MFEREEEVGVIQWWKEEKGREVYIGGSNGQILNVIVARGVELGEKGREERLKSGIYEAGLGE